MFKSGSVLLTAASLLFSSILLAETDNPVWDQNHIERAVLTSSVDNNEPTDDLGDEYQLSGADYDRITFFTQVINHANRDIKHRWYRNQHLQAEVNLAIGSDNWRTYSTKRLQHIESGDWTVRVVNENDDLLLEYHFTVKPQS
ncbi:hypothetical protein CWE09_11820 [Aliidiomarina minuta]|uniref:DUF2914 domain-containing protein n=1 Tax=Aliidiomarina minuta TaxID=880057 RepID=A0A432W389_9GAMM|nr:DUF2914 domain-containing protein [Aliidiomarina minuta]RUO23835.1 hypothetical protein CWE09_11820 [Aliidiomarina minuta]